MGKCYDFEKRGVCPRKFCRWCGTADLPQGVSKRDVSGKGAGQIRIGIGLGASPRVQQQQAPVSQGQCTDVLTNGFCPRKFCRWCGTADLPQGVKKRKVVDQYAGQTRVFTSPVRQDFAPPISQCNDMLTNGVCPRKFCRWCGTHTLPPGSGKGGKGGGKVGGTGKVQNKFVKSEFSKNRIGDNFKRFPAEQKLWLGNLPESVTAQALKEHIMSAGSPIGVHLGKAKEGIRSGGAAFKTAEEANDALDILNGTELNGYIIEADLWEALPKAAEGEEVATNEDAGPDCVDF